MASCCEIDEPPWTTALARRFSISARKVPSDVDAEMVEEAPVLGGEHRLDEMVGHLLERHRIALRMPRLPISLP